VCITDVQVAKKGTPYQGPPVDAWSCGVVLFVLLVGNTPWDEPTSFSPEYKYYKTNNKALFKIDPWNRIDPEVMRTSQNWRMLT
jgi:serine/threonine-protein kinase CHEK1